MTAEAICVHCIEVHSKDAATTKQTEADVALDRPLSTATSHVRILLNFGYADPGPRATPQNAPDGQALPHRVAGDVRCRTAQCSEADTESPGLQVANVTTIMVMSETLPLARVKSRFSEMVDRVEHTHDRIIVTRNGRPAAVLISPEELDSLEDTLDLLSDPDAMHELDESRQAYAAGDFVTGDELRSRYNTR